MALINTFIIICLLLTVGYMLGLLMFLTDHGENRCEMTYMFQYPQFVRIRTDVDDTFKKYSLHAYSEGHLTEITRKMHFSGIPVLFIPGNAGSHRQVRSFASVSLRKSLNKRPGFHFDYFAVNLNGELSGLNGALLDEQMQYVKTSISRVLELYNNDNFKPKPTSVILIGHSMGGIIARGLLSNLPVNSTLLPLIISLAAPHLRPPLASDFYMADYYKKMEKSVVYPTNSTVVSLSGGYNDFIIQPALTNANNFKNIHVVTTSVPLMWLPTDHLCILWCKQLVLAVVRSLFDLVNPETKQISLNPLYHEKVFNHHLVQHSGTKLRQSEKYKKLVSFNHDSSKWIENLLPQHTISLPNGAREVQYHMIRLISEDVRECVTILALNLEVTDWAFYCSATHTQERSRICLEGNHLSHKSEIAPAIKYKRRLLQINLHALKRNHTEATHVIVKVLPTDEPVTIHVDIYKREQRKIEITLPKWWSLFNQKVIHFTESKVIEYELVLPELYHVIQSYKLYVQPTSCSNRKHHATASLKVPWGNEDAHQYFTGTEKNPLIIRLYKSKPHGLQNMSASVRLILDPVCTYSLSVSHSVLGVLNQLARNYSPLLIANVTAVILLTFRNQLNRIHESGNCSLFFNAIQYGIKPYYILTIVKLTSKVLSLKGLAAFPIPDWKFLADEGSDFFVLPILLYMTSVGIVWLAALGIAVSLIVCESTITKFASKFLARTVTGAIKFSDWLIGGLQKIPCVVAVILVVLSVSTCGGLALCLGCVFYFLKLTQMSQDLIESLVIRIAKYLAKKLKQCVLRRTDVSAQNVSSQLTNEEIDNRVEDVSKAQAGDEAEENKALNKTKSAIEVCLESKPSTSQMNGDKIITEENEKKELDNGVSDSDDEENNQKESAEDEETSAVAELQGEENHYENIQDKQIVVADEKIVNTVQDESSDQCNTRSNGGEENGIFFHFTIFLLWIMVTLINIPSVLTWAHNFKFNTSLQPDPSFFPGAILSLCAIPLWHLELPKADLRFYPYLGYLFHAFAVISLIYAPLSIYRLVYIITATISIITLHQLFAPVRSDLSETVGRETFNSSEPESLYDRVKAKWE